MRSDDSNKYAGTRSGRMYQKNGLWFFKTRQGGDVGPFADKLEACTQLEAYIRAVESGMELTQPRSEVV
ncbi:MAG: hypothetical protein Hals2KO_11050 [Halioglobus sp.]